MVLDCIVRDIIEKLKYGHKEYIYQKYVTNYRILVIR